MVTSELLSEPMEALITGLRGVQSYLEATDLFWNCAHGLFTGDLVWSPVRHCQHQ